MPKSKPELGAGILYTVKEPYPPASPLKHGDYSQLSKALACGSYFLSGCMAINASQFLGAPLYLINKNWYNAWMAFTKQSFGLLTMTMTHFWAPTVMRVSGDKSVRGQLLQTLDGNLLCDFPERLILIANHQIYTDWLYLWWIGYTGGMHGRIYIVLKESLKRIPIIGWGMQFSQFIFLKRNWEKDKPHLASHLQKLNKAFDPMWLMIFPEGTNLAPCTRQASFKWAQKKGIQDMQHQLLPRSTGLQFCLQELRKTVDYVYDCTIAYEGVPRGQYAQDVFTVRASYFEGRPPKSVNMYWRRFAVSSIPIDDSKAFEIWLRARWTEKDKLLDGYLRTRRFPADEGVGKARDGKTRRGAGYIETEIKASHWYEFLQIFAPIGLFALVLYMFYGALPRTFLKSINKQAVLDKIEAIQKDQIKGREKKLLISPVPKASSTGLKKAAATQETASKNKSTQKALHDGGSSRKVDMEAATTQKPAIKQGIIRKAPLKEMTTQKASITGVPSQQAQVNVAKKQQQRQQQTSAASKELRTKQETSSTPKKLEVRRETNSAPKMLNIKHKVSSTPRKLESKKPEAKHEASSTSKKLGIKHEVTSAPKKHEPKKLEPKKLDVKNEAHSAPKKVEKIPNANSETRRAPTKLEIRQKTSPSFKTKQNTRQAPKKSDTRS